MGGKFGANDAGYRYLAVNQGDGFNGWHGGPSRGESHVPLMFHMPGPALVRPDGDKNPAFVQEGFDYILTVFPPSGGYLRSWYMPHILADIVGRVRTPPEP